MSDEEPLRISDSSDDELLPSGHITQSVFQKSKGGANVQPQKDASFKTLTAGFAYNGSLAGTKRSSDAVANTNGSSGRPAKAAKQIGPARAQPVPVDLTMDDIPDFQTKRKIEEMLIVLPMETVTSCDAALRKARGDQSDALANLVSRGETNPRTVDLTVSEDELPPLEAVVPKVANKARRQVEAPARSIRDKYSTAQKSSRQPVKPRVASSPAPEIQPQEEPGSTNTLPRRRRLIKGRRAPTSPAAAPSSPVVPPVQAHRTVQTIESDEDSEVAEDDELSPERQSTLLNFVNTCSAADLVDLSGQPLENVECVLSKRPFKTLDHIRGVAIENTTTTKNGKQRISKKLVGDRMVDACELMWAGYDAVDELVAECSALGKPIAEEMQKWGINAHGQTGELEMVELDAIQAHDSGIGTPSSTAASADIDEDDSLAISRVKKKPVVLRQPQIMSPNLVMKDYQVAGLNWLALLYSRKLSCILADDMGLGKTCQVISFISHLYEVGVKGPHLIVVPGSTLENWLREFQNFSPNLRVEPYYGAKADRSGMQEFLQSEIKDINVIVTTYDTASKPQDAHFLRHLHLRVCVYDEGHALKNSESKRYKELMRIPAEFRLLLTGTPLQNNLQELISLLAFIMPAVFKGQQEKLKSIFKHRAKTTDDSSHAALLSADRIKRARSMMTPFILRRKKHQVLKHLPAKTRRVEYCDMTSNQKSIYDSEFTQFRKDLLTKDADAQAKAKSKAKATAAAAKATTNVMMKLRQAAIHPLLLRRLYDDARLRKMAKDCVKEDRFRESNVDLVFEDFQVFTDFGLHKFCMDERQPGMEKYTLKHDEWMDSGKVKALVALLEAHKANGDRTLVFSQFVMVMDILEEVLETINVPYVRLDGSTKMEERQEQIDLYHADASIQVFLLSTKAGGAGINLACANKVIIFDSSFNPQDDIQAENRAHRVGQKREVEVVRLVTRDTIEEQIHALGESKLTLDDRVAGVGGGDDAAVCVGAADGPQGDEAAAEHEGQGLVERMMREKVVVGHVEGVKGNESTCEGTA